MSRFGCTPPQSSRAAKRQERRDPEAPIIQPGFQNSPSYPLHKSHKHEPQRPAFPQFSPQGTRTMKRAYFSHKNEISTFSFHPTSISLFSPSPSNILVTSSHRGAPSLAFFGWCSFTQALALVGRVIRSCCSMVTPARLGLSASAEETARPLRGGFAVAWCSSDHSLPPAGMFLRHQNLRAPAG